MRAGDEERGALRRLIGWSTVAIRRAATRSVLPLAPVIFGAEISLAQERLETTDIRSEFQGSPTAVPDPALPTVPGIVHVPACSEIRIMAGRTLMGPAATPSVHDTSGDKPLVIERIDSFDTAGALMQSCLGKPVALRPNVLVHVETQTHRDDNRQTQNRIPPAMSR